MVVRMERPEAELIAAVIKGDAASFEPLVAKFSPRVFATARRYARRESEVEDIVQEVWLKAFAKLKSFRGEAPFEHWLMRMAVRTCYDFLRAHQRKPHFFLQRNLRAGRGLAGTLCRRTGQRRRGRGRGKTADWPRAGKTFARGAAGHPVAGNRRPFRQGDRRNHRLVGSAGESPRVSRARRNAENPFTHDLGKIFVTLRKFCASKVMKRV